MGRTVPPGWLAALGLAFLVGCATTAKKPRFPEDPLLISKAPVERKPADARAASFVVRAEPVVPPFPATLLASKPEPESPPKTSPSADPPPAGRVVRATPAARRRVSGTYGQAADLSWLQGVLEKSPGGSLQLRYVAPSTHDGAPAAVTLEDDPRFASFRPGDVIHVEGEAVTPERYRARAIWLVKRGE